MVVVDDVVFCTDSGNVLDIEVRVDWGVNDSTTTSFRLSRFSMVETIRPIYGGLSIRNSLIED